MRMYLANHSALVANKVAMFNTLALAVHHALLMAGQLPFVHFLPATVARRLWPPVNMLQRMADTLCTGTGLEDAVQVRVHSPTQ